MRLYLTKSQDGRILVQVRTEGESSVGDVLFYVSPGQAFMNISYDDLFQKTPGYFDIPENPDLVNVEPAL